VRVKGYRWKSRETSRKSGDRLECSMKLRTWCWRTAARGLCRAEIDRGDGQTTVHSVPRPEFRGEAQPSPGTVRIKKVRWGIEGNLEESRSQPGKLEEVESLVQEDGGQEALFSHNE